jgi:CheY-like chemotaxis protein
VEESSPPRVSMILIVDDNDDMRVLTKWFFDNFGYAVDSAQSPQEALLKFDPQIHDLVLTDNTMTGMTGAELAHIIKMRSQSTFVVMHTGNPPLDQSCIDAMIQKPSNLLEVKAAVDKLLAEKKADI